MKIRYQIENNEQIQGITSSVLLSIELNDFLNLFFISFIGKFPSPAALSEIMFVDNGQIYSTKFTSLTTQNYVMEDQIFLTIGFQFYCKLYLF